MVGAGGAPDERLFTPCPLQHAPCLHVDAGTGCERAQHLQFRQGAGDVADQGGVPGPVHGQSEEPFPDEQLWLVQSPGVQDCVHCGLPKLQQQLAQLEAGEGRCSPLHGPDSARSHGARPPREGGAPRSHGRASPLHRHLDSLDVTACFQHRALRQEVGSQCMEGRDRAMARRDRLGQVI